MNPVYQITAQLDTLSSMASKWPPFGTKLGILPLAPKCTQHTKFQTIWTIGIDFGIWGIFVLVGKLLMHIPLYLCSIIVQLTCWNKFLLSFNVIIIIKMLKSQLNKYEDFNSLVLVERQR